MPTTVSPFSGLLDHPASIDLLRAAAGIVIPNRAFRDRNPSLYTGSYAGPDGVSWSRSVYRSWFYYGAALNDAYGSNVNAKRPGGAYDAETMYMSTDDNTTTGEDIANNHRVLAVTAFTDHLPFGALFQGHTDKPISFALTARIPTDVTIGTHLQAWLGCYGSDGLYDGAVELEFDDDGSPGVYPTWGRYLARTKSALPSTTHWVQLHIGLLSPDGLVTGLEVAEVSLFLNPANTDLATDASPELFIDMEDVKLRAGTPFGFQAPGVMDHEMLDGSTRRTRTSGDDLKYTLTADFTASEFTEERLRRLLTIWNLGTRGLGFHVPYPVPLAIDFGLGTGPFFDYFWPVQNTIPISHHRTWQLANQRFMAQIQFRAA